MIVKYISMNKKIKSMDKVSDGKYWFPGESVGAKSSANENKNEPLSGIPELTKMVAKWRIEREEIIKNKQIQKKKSQAKKMKNLDQNKIIDKQKSTTRKKIEKALQNTLKKRDDYDFLLSELEYFENEGKNWRDSSLNSQEFALASQYDKFGLPDITENNSDAEKEKNSDALTLKQIFSTQSTVKTEGQVQKFPDRNPNTFVYKKLVEEVFLRLKKQEEQDSISSLNISLYDDNFFKDSYGILKNLYEKEMKTLNIKGSDDIHLVQYSFQTFPPFPSSIKELDVLSNNPLIVFREWCHFHKLTPIPLEKTNKETLVNEYTSSSANDHERLTSLCTLIHLYSEFYPTTAESQESTEIILTCHDLQKSSSNQDDELGEILHNTLRNSYGKIKLGTALALTLTGRSNENRDIICSTLISAVKGITSVERRMAAITMAYAGMFDHAALHILLEEWKSAQYAHTLQQYLTALRWLSIHESSIIRSVAEYLTARNLHFRLYVCLTLPFLEGNLPVSTKDTLIHLMRNSSALILRLAAARVLECKQRGDCVQEHILMTMSSPNILRVLEVIQLSLMLRYIDPKIAGILLPCLNSHHNYVKMIALSVVEKLHINNSGVVEAMNKVVFDKDPEVRATALNTLCLIDVPGSKVESLAFTALISESNETVYSAVLKLIGATKIKGKILQKLLRNSFKKPHSKENQRLILNLLESIESESPDVSSDKSPPSILKSLDQDTLRNEKSKNSNSMTYYSLENSSHLPSALNLLENRTIPKLSSASGNTFDVEDDKVSYVSRRTYLSDPKKKVQFKKNIRIQHTTY